jgi:hypothetical protein
MICNTTKDIDEETSSVEESKIDILTINLDGLKMVECEGLSKMYSRLCLLTNEIAELRSTEMTNYFILQKKIVQGLTPKYDIACTLFQMIPNYKDLKPIEVTGTVVVHDM